MYVLNDDAKKDKLKIAKVIPIFKKDGPSLFENYIPISLLPIISKVLEKTYFYTIIFIFQRQKFAK